jgi:hypothetical protein
VAPDVTDTPSATSSPLSSPLVGMWDRETTCEDMVAAFEAVGMVELAPTALAGNGLVQGSAQQLAERDDLCEGAKPRLHSHFFTEDGRFGSLDWNAEPVDDGIYEIVDDDTVHIGPPDFGADFDFTVEGDTLTLEPIIPPAAKQQALQNRGEFSSAVWSVSVAFGGLPWHRGECGGWC